MARILLGMNRKTSDDRQPRFQQTQSRSPNPSSSPSKLVVPPQEDNCKFTSFLPRSFSSSKTRRLSNRSRKNSETNPGPLGLNIIYAPKTKHKVDVVFIHGLGGTSRKTWSKNEDPELFWPLKFLPLDNDLSLTRILTFGYDANFRTTGNLSTSVLDFAKGLLFDLKYTKDEQMNDLGIGNVPLLFVVHSMGGLIIKEAYIQGQNDPEYESIIKAISSITFLATPHRGTNLAEVLDRILRSTFFIGSKQYVSELARNSSTLQKLNEQFRHIAPRLDIISFYETQPTSLGLKSARIMILEKESSVLGYPGEISRALNADHHNVCKYDDPNDPNYIIVKNALKSLVHKIISTDKSDKPRLLSRRESQDLKSLLAITELPDTDYMFFRDQWAEGTNHWILEEKIYLEWVRVRDSTSSLLWLNGGAATGKSVLSSFIIKTLVEQGNSCQYFFIRFGDQAKRTLSLLLRSIAYQVARSMPEFLQGILQLADEGIDFEIANPRTIWERIFQSTLFHMKGIQPLYWIIDGFDEAEDPRAIIRLLSDVPSSSTPIRILLVGRNTSDVTAALQKLPKILNFSKKTIEGHVEDLRCYVHQELSMYGTAQFKESIVQRMIRDAQSNFLWVRLAVEKLNLSHTQADVELALQQLPVGMEALYDRMASSIAQNPSETDRALASAILQCVTCSLRVLTVAELSQALHADVSRVLDFQRSIVDLCGGFIFIDRDGNVSLIHQSAREYLLGGNDRPFHVHRDAADKRLFLNCMRCLTTIGLRAKIKANQKPEFLDYATSAWSFHLTSTPADCMEVVETLNKFLTSYWVLTWIQVLATNGELRTLVQASKHLSKYFAKRKKEGAEDDRDYIVKQELIGSWAEDFVKIIGKFGTVLRQNPESIYKLIPPFCPQKSAIYQQFGKMKDKSLTVSGLATEKWDDSIARIGFGLGNYASSISVAGAQIAFLISSGIVVLYDSSTFEQSMASPITHGERLYTMKLNSNGTLLATYGYSTTKIWDSSTGKCRISAKNIESRPRPLAMLLTNNGTELFVGTDDRRVRSLDLNRTSPTWKLVAELEEPELEGHFLNSSNYMALSQDARLIAVAYRGHPLSAWEIEGPIHIGHCWRKREEVARGEVIEAFWHPHYPELLGLYIEGVVFKWRPYVDANDELATGASRLAISGDGNLFATGDVRGTVKVYTESDFCLLYQLASEDTVVGLVFSPDLRRFYDTRGFYGSAWEPSALRRFAEQIGKGTASRNETESATRSFTVSESRSQRVDSITVLADSPIGRLYCSGTEKGAVRLHNMQRRKRANIYESKSFLSIEKMTWSNDGRYICFSDVSKKVVIMSITPEAGELDPLVEMKASIPMKNNTNGPILQLLFHPDSTQLLVRCSSSIRSCSPISGSVTLSLEMCTAESTWITHPQDTSLIIGIGCNTIRIFDWNLTEHYVYNFEYPRDQSTPLDLESFQHQRTVDRILVTQDKEHILLQISLKNQSSKERAFLCFETSTLPISTTAESDIDQKSGSIAMTPFSLPRNISSQIALVLSFLSHKNLIFLSKTYSICSWRLPSQSDPSFTSSTSASCSTSIATRRKGSTAPQTQHRDDVVKNTVRDQVEQLFWLPGDWINPDCLTLCRIWDKERSLLCPMNGEIAVVRCAALM